MNNTQIKAFEAIVADPAFWDIFLEFNRQQAVEGQPIASLGEFIDAMARIATEAEIDGHAAVSAALH